MQLQGEQNQLNLNSITHSPYYGCTIRVISKANVSYEGILDGISRDKNRMYLKNVRVKGNIYNISSQDNSVEELGALNAVMIDHLTNDMHIYEQVCLNVRDIHEVKLLRVPATFHESKAKLHAIDSCLIDICLSPSDGHERLSNELIHEYDQLSSIDGRSRNESIGSNGGGTLISSNSNESSSSSGYRSGENFADENHNESFDEKIKKFNRLSTAINISSEPSTLVAKKVLSKKIERNHLNSSLVENCETNFTSTQVNNSNILKQSSLNNHRKLSPIRVTITSKLNPNATPFYAQPQQHRMLTSKNSLPTHYNQNQFQSDYQPIISSYRSQSIPNEVNTNNSRIHQQQNHHHPHQQFIPPRQMRRKKYFNSQTPSQTVNYRVCSTSLPDKQSYIQQQQQQQPKYKTLNHEEIPELIRQTLSSSIVKDETLSTLPIRKCLSIPTNNQSCQSSIILRPTGSLPYQHRNSGDCHQLQTTLSLKEPIGSRRPRTTSGTSSGSSLSIDIGPHSIVQFDSTSNILTSTDGQYDFEKANEEFRRYLELEELVIRRASSVCSIGSHPDDNSNQQQSQAHSYKKEVSFFDRISCTATTGTAVAYTEMNELEKNRETFGDDALRFNSDLNDIE